jgi:Na+-transporting methylmalonyl-CoA/oxaloacetate decarboxylase gamma subunit
VKFGLGLIFSFFSFLLLYFTYVMHLLVGRTARPKRADDQVRMCACSCGDPNDPKQTVQRVRLDSPVGDSLKMEWSTLASTI